MLPHHCRLFVSAVALLTLAVGLSRPASADNHAKDAAFIRDAIKKTDTAANKRDAKAAVAFTHADFVNLNKKGAETTHGKSERETKLAGMFTFATDSFTRTTVKNIQFIKDGAIVDTQSASYLMLAQKNQKIRLNTTGTYRDFWIKTASGTWQQKRSRALSETNTVNDKPMP